MRIFHPRTCTYFSAHESGPYLVEAAEKDDLETVERLVGIQRCIYEYEKYVGEAYQKAAKKGHEDIVKYLAQQITEHNPEVFELTTPVSPVQNKNSERSA